MAHALAVDQGKRSIGIKVRVGTDGQTDGQTEAIALPPVLRRSVISDSANGFRRSL